MGTRGYRAVRRKGVYFISYNHSDSYPEGLGDTLVSSIPRRSERYRKWLSQMIERWDGIYDTFCDENGELYEESEMGAPQHEFAVFPSEDLPRLDSHIEWTYTIDLDRMAFTVDNQAHFRLDVVSRLPGRNWIEYLDLDSKSRRCLSPTTPRKYVADISLPLPEVDATGLDAYKSLELPITVDPEAFLPTGTGPEVQTAASNAFKELTDYYSYYTRAPALEKDDVNFKAITLSFLATASPSFLQTAAAFAGGFKDLPSQFEEFIDNTRSQSSFWIRGALVHLSTHLESEEHLTSQLGPLIQHLQTEREHTQAPQLTGLLWSMKAFVAVKVTATSIVRSPLYPILELFGVKGGTKILKENLLILSSFLQMKTTLTKSFFSARIPLELMEFVLADVKDEATYLSFAFLCKTLFSYVISHPHSCCKQRALLFDYIWE